MCCAVLQVARAVLLLVCWWPFNYTGYPLSWRSALVMVWGGLRGAVGMVMALFIFLDTRIHDSRFKSYCIFYMGTMAFFTVLINGGSTKVGVLPLQETCRKSACRRASLHGECTMVCVVAKQCGKMLGALGMVAIFFLVFIIRLLGVRWSRTASSTWPRWPSSLC
jgi:NhaP-type Na+/H+ or K+/H+ antiporter